MIEWVLGAAAIAALLLAGYILLKRNEATKQLDEYKQLFDSSEDDNKELNGKVEQLLHVINDRNLQVERSTSAGEQLAARLGDNIVEMDAKEGIIEGLRTTLEYEQEQYAKLIGQKKSSEVRTGMIAEQMAPFLKDYPSNPRTARFIGDPIDFVHFDEDKVTFVEVKSGKSQLSKKQRMIRDLIKDGKVEFVLYRIEGKDDGPN